MGNAVNWRRKVLHLLCPGYTCVGKTSEVLNVDFVCGCCFLILGFLLQHWCKVSYLFTVVARLGSSITFAVMLYSPSTVSTYLYGCLLGFLLQDLWKVSYLCTVVAYLVTSFIFAVVPHSPSTVSIYPYGSLLAICDGIVEYMIVHWTCSILLVMLLCHDIQWVFVCRLLQLTWLSVVPFSLTLLQQCLWEIYVFLNDDRFQFLWGDDKWWVQGNDTFDSLAIIHLVNLTVLGKGA